MGEKSEIRWDAGIKPTLDALGGPGLLLVTQGRSGKPNAMTIGWASIGRIWGRPVFTVLVRASRFSYQLLEENGDFTVNVMPSSMTEAVAYCGAVSGMDHDKFADKNMTALAPAEGRTPIIAESLLAYECRTLLTTEMDPGRLDSAVRNSAYAKGDYHRIFYGEILCVRAERGAI